MFAARLSLLGAAVLITLGAVGGFVLSTVVMDQMPDTLLVGVAGLVAGLVVAVVRFDMVVVEIKGAGRGDLTRAGVGGVLALWAAPLLVLSQRATDAPSGTDVLFFTTTVWGLGAVLVGALVSGGARVVWRIAGPALVAAAGAAALLASWERPSSFSPLAKFPTQEAVMVLAGVLFVGGCALIADWRAQTRTTLTPVAVGAGAAGVLGMSVALLDVGAYGATLVRLAPALLVLGVAQGALAAGWVTLSRSGGIAAGGAALMLTPVATTLLFFLERATGIYGPMPFQVPGVIAGVVVCVLGLVAVWVGLPSLAGSAPARPSNRSTRWAEYVGWSAVAAASVALVRPAMVASARGVLGVDFSATWQMVGAETAAGWLTIGAALAVVAAARSVKAGLKHAAASALTAAAGAVAATALVWNTTLHTWNRWIPASVQQTYGTEYARFSVAGFVEPVWLAAVVLSVLSACFVVLALVAAPTGAVEHVGEEIE